MWRFYGGSICSRIQTGKGIQDALTYAIAVSAANAINPETGHIRKEDVENILPQVEIKKL